MKNSKALIVVDVQNDFCPGGALAVAGGDTIIPTINNLLTQFDLVIFTKDWHPENHLGFASQHKGYKPFMHLIMYRDSGGFGGTMDISENNQIDMGILWPDHCVQNTPGADFHPDLKIENCKDEFYIFKKGEDVSKQGYSAFEEPELSSFLDGKGISQLYFCGLTTDCCVHDSAIDAADKGFEVTVIKDACKGIQSDLTLVYKNLIKHGVTLA